MTAPAATVTVGVDELEVASAQWCDRCLLPSVVQGWFVLLLNRKPDHVFTYRECMECGANRFG